MEKLIKFFLVNSKFTIMLSLFVGIGGIMGASSLNNESFPAVNFATATIETDYRGAAPGDVENKITKPIEDKIREVSGLKDVRSISRSGKSSIIARVDMDNEDVDEVMGNLEKAVNQVSNLPIDLQEDPNFNEINSEEFPAIQIALVGSNINRFRDEVADHLKEELEDNKRIKNVILSGFRKREFLIELDQNALNLKHIGINEVLRKIKDRNVDVPGGDLVKNSYQKLVRLQAKVQNKEDLENLLIRSNFSGQKVYLKDVAQISDTAEEPRYLSRYNGKEATILIVNKKAGADTLKLVEEVDGIIQRYQKLYKGKVDIVVFDNESERVKNRFEILTSNAVSGLVLVIVFMLIFLPGKIGISASLSLPIAVMATFGIMPSLGMNLDAITILALVIALGMLVDNSVVISENFTRLKKNGWDSYDAAVKSVKQLALPISATALTTMAAFLPMLVTKGIMGEFIKFIPIIVTIALLFSLLESFFLLPLRLRFAGDRSSFKSGSDADKGANRDWFDSFVSKFESLMEKLIRHRYKTAMGFTLLLTGSFFMMGVLNTFILFPADQTEVYWARFETKKGATLQETDRVAADLSTKIKEVLGESAISIIGKIGSSQENPMDPRGKEGKNAGILTIYVDEHTKNNVDYREVLKKLRQIKMENLSELVFQERVNGPPVGAAINATFRSNDQQNLETILVKIKERLKNEEGVFDLKVDDVINADEIFTEINYSRADQLGLSITEIGNVIRTVLSGNVVSDVILNNKTVDLRVKMLEKDRDSTLGLSKTRVTDNRGNLVPLSKIAHFREAPGTPQIKRFDFKRSKTLTGNVDGQTMTSPKANSIIMAEFKKLQKDFPEVSLVFGGEQESTNESMESLGKAMILAIIGIFALMVFVFGSYLRPLIIISTIPLGLVGFSIAFFFHDRPISFLAMIGIVGLAGIIVNSGIVLISFIDNMRAEGKMSLDQILVKASGMRLRAVVVTSLTTVSGLFPTAYGIGGSDAILIPMTLAMAWGLTSGTILTLLWAPCAYAILEDGSNLFKKSFKS